MEIEKIDDQITQSMDDFIGRLVVAIAQTPVSNRIAKSVLSKTMQEWSKRGYVRGKLAGPAEKIISRLFLESTTPKESNILDDAATIKATSDLLPHVINGSVEIMIKLAQTVRTVPSDVRAEYLASVISRIDTKQTGQFITDGLRLVNDLLQLNPEFLTGVMKVPVRDLIASTDFGELKEMFDGLEDFFVPLLKVMNDELWNYPAKFVNVAGCIPPLVNGGTKAINEIVRPLNNLAPEILADVVFSVLRSFQGKEIGLLVNSIMELGRKLYTGSLLLADSNLSQFSIDSKSLLQDVVSTVNPELLYKFQVALSEAAETITKSYTDAVSRNPEIYTAMVSAYAGRKNPKIRAAKLKISMFENVSEEEAANAVSQGLSDLDTREIGEIINAAIRYIKLIRTHKPEVIPHLLSEVALSIDAGELQSVADDLIGDVVHAVKPAVRVLMPSLLKGLTTLLSPDENEEQDDLNEAVLSLIKVLAHKGE